MRGSLFHVMLSCLTPLSLNGWERLLYLLVYNMRDPLLNVLKRGHKPLHQGPRKVLKDWAAAGRLALRP
jgi:hypothetical protein